MGRKSIEKKTPVEDGEVPTRAPVDLPKTQRTLSRDINRPKKSKKIKQEMVSTMRKQGVENYTTLDTKSIKKKLKKKHVIAKDDSTTKPYINIKSSKMVKIKKTEAVADNNVVTSEGELDGFKNNSKEMDQHPKSNSDKVDVKLSKENRFPGREYSIFIGNLPNTAKKSTVKTFFKPFGKILTIRFRTIDGVILLKKKDRKEAKALNCYVRFETKKEAEAACSMNGEIVEGNRIRVSLQSQKQLGHHASTVFVDTTDNELYAFFSKVGDIEYVRQISGKYIGYVCFKKGVSIAKALKLDQQLLNGRPLRIMKVNPQKQHVRRNKKGNIVSKKTQSVSEDISFNGVHLTDRQPRKKASSEFLGAVAKPKGHYKRKAKKSPSEKKLAQKLTAVGIKIK
ncbi:RNA-binding protein 34 isoform X2 [Topomyia yanbarensis]|uniref:RNA-binding protein 34 isoform X2 n=1 Tax=Topomyia yanbarensis TaxID=2498891 RepID=UPI00273AC5CB|nr:RNA-binding protein 34 isoform X2 [Topomyia yanbarensis]